MNYDVVVTGIQPWDIDIGSNCKNIALEFSKTRRVLYVNTPLDRITRWKNRNSEKVQRRLDVINGKTSPYQQINDNLTVLTPPVVLESMNWLPDKLFRIVNRRNSKMFAHSIKRSLSELNFDKFILFTDSDMFRSRELPDLLKPEAFLYYSRDNLMTVPYWAKHGAQMEPEIMRAASAVVTNSPHLANLAAKANDNSIYVGQGCEIDEYLNVDKDQVPNDLKSLQGPIVGYTGLLTSRRLSIDLIEYAAKKLPHFNFVLVGPEESCFEKSILHELENVFFLGSKKPEDLPAYVSNFDVCINPQIVNELTKGNYPRKVDEYLAAGKPVVATYTPTMEVFKKYCFLVNNGDEFVRALEVAKNSVDEVNIRERQDFAATHSWGNSVKEIYRVVEDVLNNKIKAYA